MTTATMKITEARQKFTQFPKFFSRRPEVQAVEVESHGHPVMAVLSWEMYESLLETLEVMGDPKLMKMLRKSMQEADQGKTIPWETVKTRLKL